MPASNPHGGKPPHRRGTYATEAKAVRDQANANPATRCWRCGRTLTEIRRTKPHAVWDAGHVIDGQIGGPLRAECSPCNRGRGAAMGNRKRSGKPTRRTPLTW
jgi:hypothetical protein